MIPVGVVLWMLWTMSLNALIISDFDLFADLFAGKPLWILLRGDEIGAVTVDNTGETIGHRGEFATLLKAPRELVASINNR